MVPYHSSSSNHSISASVAGKGYALGTTLDAHGSEGVGWGLPFPQAALEVLWVGLESLQEDGEPEGEVKPGS